MGNLSRNFDTEEFKCFCCGEVHMQDDLIANLQKLRDIYGKRIDVTSGYRCRKWNKYVDGKDDSAHLTGKAADIVVDDSKERFKLIMCALEVGFRRIGIGVDFLHLDMDTTKPQDVIWIY